jgi:hypothetical protein
MEQDNRNRDNAERNENSDLDLEMERDTEIRRESQVRGSLGMPPSGGSSGSSSTNTGDRDEAVPEFDRPDDEDRGSQR